MTFGSALLKKFGAAAAAAVVTADWSREGVTFVWLAAMVLVGFWDVPPYTTSPE